MARQDIDIGVEGNDGTGDSIRESFRKVNENFQEIYAVFGQGGSIQFTSLSDTPDALLPNTIPLVNDSGDTLQLVELASNSALDETAQDTITFSYSVAGKLVISTAFTKLSDDQKPALGGPLNVGNNAIANVAISQGAVDQFNDRHNTNLTIDDLVITKGYADRRYISSGLPIRVAAEPANTDAYILEINRYIDGNIDVVGHGYDTGINGTAFIFKSVYDDPTNLTSDNTYYLRYISDDQFSVHNSRNDATEVDDGLAAATKIYITGNIADDDTHTMTDKGLDVSLEGNFLSDVAMPRTSIVRRQGDTMAGTLTLNDHPGDLAGFGILNGDDDLQAATKLYVDNSGYASTVNLFVSTNGDDRMIGVPPGKEGSAFNYAYRTINAAAKRAEEIIRTAEEEPGPYFQTITKNNGDATANVVSAEVDAPVYEQTRRLIEINREYVQKEISGYIAFTYPEFIYEVQTCERDTGLILDAIAFDINRQLEANYLTRRAAERYYSSTSGRYAITKQLSETVDAITTAKNIVDAILQNKLYREKAVSTVVLSGDANERARITTSTNHGLANGEQVYFKDMGGMVEIEDQSAYIKVIDDETFELYTDQELLNLWDISSYTNYTTGGRIGVVYQPRVNDYNSIKVPQTLDDPDAALVARTAVGAKFDLILNIIQNGIEAGTDVVYGSTYKLVLDNGSRTFIDQGDPENTDTLPGKVMVGEVSGAKGRIVSLTSNDGTENNQDTFQLVQLNGVDFVEGEPVKYGNFVKNKQVTLFVESGIYEEDFPIRLANNVSLKGDEFRRVIIRPKDRVSQSKWANTYFFRDKEFDGLTLASDGAPFFNQTGEHQGYFGRHYLTDVEQAVNVGPSLTNVGDYEIAPQVMRLNKKFIQDEVIYYINTNADDLLYNKTLCQRDLGYILDAIAYDTALGTNYNGIVAGRAYLRANNAYNLAYEKTNTLLAINKVKTDTLALAAVSADATALARATAAFDQVIDIITDEQSLDAFSFPVPSSLPSVGADDAATRLQNNVDFIKAEIIAWIADNYDTLIYDSAKCSRDVEYIVDAITHDILYGGNLATKIAARSYFVGTVNQLGVGESDATIAAYGRLKTILSQIVQGTTVTKTTGNAETQDTSGTNATATEGTLTGNLVDIIIDVIDAGNISGMPADDAPSISWATSGIQLASNAVLTNKSTLIGDAINYLDEEINFIYDQDKCRRDVGLIIDAVVQDLTRGGSEFVLQAQGEYYSNYILSYDNEGFGGQANITAAAINHISTLSSDLLAGNAPAQNSGTAPDTSVGVAETGTVSLVGNLIDLVTFAFDPLYNPPKRNDEVDMFLLSDATIIRNVTCQGHGGFMCVLDPEGQVLTKSPYIQTASSFSKSINEKAFRGGMYVDAFAGNIPARITNKVNNYVLDLESETGQGLFIREPLLPCPFYIEGRRFQVNAISDYDSGTGTVRIYLDAGSNPDSSGNGQGYDETIFDEDPGVVERNIFLQTAGNRSILGNDYTQINDLGYGLVCNNGAFSEMVSMFTYYCHAAYYAANGSEIRSLNGSNGYGFFGLVAEGADPNEIPDQVTLRDNMVVPAKASTTATTPNAFDDAALYVMDMEIAPTINSLITIDHGGSTGVLNYVISNVDNISDTLNNGTIGDSVDDLAVGSINTFTNVIGADASRTPGTYTNLSASGSAGGTGAKFKVVVDGSGAPTISLEAKGYGYRSGETLTIADAALGGGGAVDVTFDTDDVENDSAVPNIRRSYAIYKLDLRADDITAVDFYGTLQATVANEAYIDYKHNFTQIFDGVRDTSRLVTRPSTAINFDETDLVTYRSLSFQNTDSFAVDLPANQINAGFEVGYDFIEIEIDTANLSGGYGDAQGDTNLAVIALTNPATIIRLLRDTAGRQPGDAGYAGGMVFTWRGKTHQITNYDASGAFAYITVSDVANTNIHVSYTGTGLNEGFVVTPDETYIKAGLQSGSTAEITIAISLCRATGHDFTQIGTGGFNDSNYPNVILGDPENGLADSYSDAPTATSAQVWERRKGRVFWMSTDQFGFFRVGKFFSVDQATGDIEFAGEIGLTNANSLGFKRGVTINEFSADDSMSDNSGQAVPVEKAVVGYINRVLGYNVGSASQIDAPPTGNRIGPGFLPLDGDSAMEGNIDMGSNQITNVAAPGSDGTAAANKNYVDGVAGDFDEIQDLRNTEINSYAANDLFVATGKKRLVTTPVAGGTWSIGDTIGLPQTGTPTKTGTVVDIESTTDPILGSINIITYTPTLGTFASGETLYDLPGGSAYATIEDGPFDEWANASEATSSVINWTVSRTDSGTTIDFQIEDDTIMNADVNSAAGISQSKLAMQSADTFDEDDSVSGWAGSATKVQADLGLAKFSDENFETTSGYVRIKDNGLVFAELEDIDQYTLYGRQTSGTGDPEKVAYSDAVKYGSGLEDKDFLNSEWTETSLTILTLNGPVSVIDGETITQAGSGATGTVQGYVNLENKLYIYNVSGIFNATGELTGASSGALGSNSVPNIINSDTVEGFALIQTGAGTYATTQISSGTAADSIARRDANGKLDASAIKVGGFDTLTLASSTISIQTPGGATILSAAGNDSNTLITSVPGSLDVGGTGITAQSNAQSGSTYAAEGFISTDWIYTNFIEAESERSGDAGNTTGIGLGTGNGFTGNAADTILLIADGSPRLTVTSSGATFSNALNVDGNLTANGNVALGNEGTDTITVNGEMIFSATGTIGSNVLPDGNGTRNLGASGTRFGTIYADVFNGVATEAKYADLAEKYLADAEYEPGTVLIFGGKAEVSITNTKGDHRVAGVVSTNPAHLMNADLEGEHVVELALTGRVPCKVLGPVKKGDMLVTSAIAGYAVASRTPGVGTVIGKALENKDSTDRGVIEIVVGRV